MKWAHDIHATQSDIRPIQSNCWLPNISSQQFRGGEAARSLTCEVVGAVAGVLPPARRSPPRMVSILGSTRSRTAEAKDCAQSQSDNSADNLKTTNTCMSVVKSCLLEGRTSPQCMDRITPSCRKTLSAPPFPASLGFIADDGRRLCIRCV